MTDERITRRDYLTRGAGAVFTAAAASVAGIWLHHQPASQEEGERRESFAGRKADWPNYFDTIDYPPSSPRLSVAVRAGTGHAADSSASPASQRAHGEIESLVRAAIGGLDHELGIRRFIVAGDVVLIKPNVGFDRPPALGATTHPEIVEATTRLCREAGAKEVLITDNPIESVQACFERSGIARAADAGGARIIQPRKELFEETLIRERGAAAGQRGALERWPILTEPLRRATKLIGIAPVKDHNLAGGSMCLKNWFGFLGGRRNRLHQAIHETISDLAWLFSPTLVIADATRAMVRSGPTGGRLGDVRPGGALGRPAIVAAVDPVACDAWCYENLLERDPGTLPYLQLAQEKIERTLPTGGFRFGRHHWREYERQGLIARSGI